MAGQVHALKFTSPHGSLAIVAKNSGGTTTRWVMALGSVSALAQKGIGKTGPNALHVGPEFFVNPGSWSLERCVSTPAAMPD